MGNVYPFLLSLFFALHYWRLYYFAISPSEVIKTILILFLINGAIFLASKFFVIFFWKSAFVAFVMSFLLLFINPILSSLKLWNVNSSSGLQLLLVIIITGVSILFVRKIKKPFYTFIFFLNITLTAVVCAEIALLSLRENHKRYTTDYGTKLIGSETGELPSVYVIVFDEYAGQESLKQNFKYNNDAQIKALRDRGFKVVSNATSNYQHTVLSVPSIFKGDYIVTPSGETPHREDAFRLGLAEMYYNSTYRLFKESGYQTLNYSPFEIYQNPAAYKTSFLPKGTMLILHSTLIAKLSISVPIRLLMWLKRKELIESYYSKIDHEPKKIIEEMLNESEEYKSQPVFCYTHLMLPHGPYLYDSSGRINTEYLIKSTPLDSEQKDAYIQSVVYANKLMIDIVDRLKKHTKRETFIIIMSDHGYKSHLFNKSIWGKFNCFNAIYSSGGKTDMWYDGMSNVNQVRVLINALTKSSVPLLKDSVVLK